jgi:uncharacterized protein (TIGR02145 family)
LYGTPPFTLIAAGGTATQTVEATSIATSAVTITPVTLTDQTGCPGVFCIYTGSDLYIDATHLCQQRASGAQNWEAWIKDARDDELYRIVLMPDNNWWLAQNVRLATYNQTTVGTAVTVSGCTDDECGRWYTFTQATSSYGGTSGSGSNVQGVCPNGWILPESAHWTSLVNSLGSTATTSAMYLTATACKCTYDTAYGWQGTYCIHRGNDKNWGTSYLIGGNAGYMFAVCDGTALQGIIRTMGGGASDCYVTRCVRPD